MIYLDYSATTKVDKRVLESFVKACDYVGNPNSMHKLGVASKALIDAATDQIAHILGVKSDEIIYTSGATESNNLAIKGMKCYFNRGMHVITTELEHSSIYGPLSQIDGLDVSFAPLKNGVVQIDELEKLITDETILVSISAVNSETGMRQPIEEIGRMLKKYPKVVFHSDITQAVGKVVVDLTNVDMASFTPHKFFGLKGIGVLVKKENVRLVPLIAGGKSTTVFRSGTPATPLIVSTAKALRLAYESLNDDISYVKKLNDKLRLELQKYDGVFINSNENSIPHILNFSVIGVKPETMLHALEGDEIYISTQSACSKGNTSKSVMAVTGDESRASSSLRVSISKKTTMDEIDAFLKSFGKNYRKLVKYED